jgi:hypothetical protein
MTNFDKTETLLPLRRTDRLAVQPIADETMLYEEDAHKAYLLNPIATAVWNACDGKSTPAEIAAAANLTLDQPVTEEFVHYTLSELRCDDLLQPNEGLPMLPLMERRDMLRRLGTAAALLVPIIAVVATPAAATSISGNASTTP